MNRQQLASLAKRTLYVLARTFAFLLALILCIPVLLLPAATATPAWVWVPLALLSIALLIFFFWRKPAWQGAAVSLAGILLVGVLAVMASQAFAMTPPITDAAGKPLPGSIATLETVPLNGSEQWVSIRGRDITNPVLLFLAGGPGGSQLATARYALGGLEDHFVVVNWEQPGAGKSFDAVESRHADAGTLHRGRPRADPAPAVNASARRRSTSSASRGAARWASCWRSATPN